MSTSSNIQCRFEVKSYKQPSENDLISWSCEDIDGMSNLPSDNLISKHLITKTTSEFVENLSATKNLDKLSNTRAEFTHQSSGKNLEAIGARIYGIEENLESFYLNNAKLRKLSDDTFDSIENLEKYHSDLVQENVKLREKFKQKDVLVLTAEENLDLQKFPNFSLNDLEGNSCINKWTYGVQRKTYLDFTDVIPCNPSVEEMQNSLAIMAKLISDLDSSEIDANTLFNECEEKTEKRNSDEINENKLNDR